MSIGKYFNRGVMALDAPHIGHVVKETDHNLVIFGENNERFDIPISEIKTTGRNVLIGLTMREIYEKYFVNRNSPFPVDDIVQEWQLPENVDMPTYQARYPNSLFSRGVRILNEDSVGFVMKETRDEIVIFGDNDQRYDIPKSKIKEVGSNVILNMDIDEFTTYKMNNLTVLPK
jgi:sporulation protein YlmC with PRC-barrel domain